MANLFKTRYVPNPDGTDSATAITNANTAFVHTYIGDDFSGDGTRESPYKSVFKANQKSGINYIVFRGVVNEAFSTYSTIIGDDINQIVVTTNYIQSINNIINSTLDSLASNLMLNGTQIRNGLIINADLYEQNRNASTASSANNLIKGKFYTSGDSVGGISIQNTVSDCIVSNQTHVMRNSIIIKSYTLNQVSKYTLFLSTCIFKLSNGTNITQPIWTNDSKLNMQLLRSAYILAGVTSVNLLVYFPLDSFGNETCRIIKEERNGGTSGNIFNRYDGSGNVLDYSLNPASNNEALYASDLGGYVGCFKPSSAMVSTMWNTPIDVNPDGTDTVNTGILLRVNSDQSIDFNTASAQIWNRIKSNTVIAIPNGIKFNGVGTMSTDGSSFGYYFGKHQNLMNGNALIPSDTLEANSIYKVCNVNRDIYSAAVYNGTQYLPDYFFKTGTSILNFTLLNAGSGTVVKKVLAAPLESIDIMPYDDLTTPSVTFPKFSCPLSGNVLMLFHKIGVNIDKPVLFSEVTNDKIAYYASWAVTNADQEFVTLAADTVNYYYKIPVLKFLLPVLNAHFNQDYDQ